MNAQPCVIVAGYADKRAGDIRKLRELCRALYQASLIFLVEKVQPGDDHVAGNVWAPSLALDNVDAALNALCHCLASDAWKDLELPLSETCLRLRGLCAELHHGWQRDLATITFALVAHISATTRLNLFVDDQPIQPRNRHGAAARDRDKPVRGQMLSEVAKVLYQNLDTEKRLFFARTLPKALHGFVGQDHSKWQVILTQLGVLEAAALFDDSSRGRALIPVLAP
ncbi:diiron oxygenase [Pseudomonas sp. MWU13-2100]|uniref:diiron oxygenase n=1 Tax=Pseudomonas sp. MWU13-2100 TaxID=2935075 RepID=UPI00200EDDE7|nr:diiron oxygenase [Pseudomonas sp. MWU13-2100]